MRAVAQLSCILVFAASPAGAAVISFDDLPVDVCLHFQGTWETVAIQTEYIDGVDQGTYVIGGSIFQGDLWFGIQFQEAVYNEVMGVSEWAVTGQITAINGTQAAGVLGRPISPDLIPFLFPEYYLVESEVLANLVIDGDDYWADASGMFQGEGISLSEFEGATFVDSGITYDFDFAAQRSSDGTNTVLARESLETVAFTFDENGLDGFITRYVSVFDGSLIEYAVEPCVVPEPGTLMLLGVGLGVLAWRKRRRADLCAH